MSTKLCLAPLVCLLLCGASALPAIGQGVFDCDDFATQEAAQFILDQNPNDPFGLDPDNNGLACDALDGGVEATVATASDVERAPLDARLGGTVEDWEAEHGPPVEQEGAQADLFTGYDLPGFSTVFADEYLGRIQSISLFSPRPAGEEWTNDETHPMDWTVPKAHVLAQRLLPRDAQCDEPDENRVGGTMTECYSDALAAEVPTEVYDYVDNTPVYGGFSYWLDRNLDDESRVAHIIIELEIEEPLQSVTGAGEPAAAGASDLEDPESAAGLTEAEQAYVDTIVEQTGTMADSFNRFSELFAAPQIGVDEWTIQTAGVLVTWRATYQEAQEMDVPPLFAEVHAVYLEGLAYFDAASYDVASGLDTFDLDLLQQAAASIALGNERIQDATALTNEIRDERSD